VIRQEFAMRLTLLSSGLLGLLAAGFAVSAAACPFCPVVSLTLSEQVAQSDAVALVQWVEGTPAKDKTPGSTDYEVLRVVKAPEGEAAPGTRITMSRFRAGKKGDLFLLIGSKADKDVEWGSPVEVSESSFNYLAMAPSPEQPTQKRLEYFLKFLEFPDDLVANDAYAEFANAPYKDLIPLKEKMPLERLRKWVSSPDTSVTRLGLYGLMLGLCGTSEDIALMEKKIAQPTEEFRLGIDGVMGGYLLLNGEKGLDLLDDLKFHKDAKVPFAETYAAMQAIRFMWTYAPDRISKDRLRQSMRSLLDRPELADLVVADLSRWKDWSVQDRLFELYSSEGYDIPSIKRSIVRYYIASTKDAPQGEKVEIPAHVTKGHDLLDKLRAKDPKLVQEAERFALP